MVVFTPSEFAEVKVPYETIGLTDCVAVTCTYSKTRGSTGFPATNGLVLPAQGVVSGPGGQAAAFGQVLSAQVQTDVTVGVLPGGKKAVSWAPVTLGFAFATSAPARVAPTRAAESAIRKP